MIDLNSEPKPQNLIRNCKFKFKCSKKWEDLEKSPKTRFDSPRRCNDCHQLVWAADNEDQLASYILHNYCVAITPELLNRTIGDEHRKLIKSSSGRLLGSYSLTEE